MADHCACSSSSEASKSESSRETMSSEASSSTAVSSITNGRRFAVQPEREWRCSPLTPPSSGAKQSLQLMGFSRSADRTFFYVPELDIALDAGECRGKTAAQVFLTHTHSDHALDLHWFATAREERGGCDIYVPRAARPHALSFIRGAVELNQCRTLPDPERDLERSMRLHGVKHGQVIEGIGRARDWQAVVFRCEHAVPCVGYAFAQRKHKLKAEYAGRDGRQLAELKRANVDITEQVVEPRFVYVGDTSVRVFELNPWLLTYPVVVVECTFLHRYLDGVDLSVRAQRDGHIVWEDSLEHLVRQHPHVTFLLIHFSLRYSVAEIEQFFAAIPDVNNVSIHACHMNDVAR